MGFSHCGVFLACNDRNHAFSRSLFSSSAQPAHFPSKNTSASRKKMRPLALRSKKTHERKALAGIFAAFCGYSSCFSALGNSMKAISTARLSCPARWQPESPSPSNRFASKVKGRMTLTHPCLLAN
jgi:hypothetical protein